MECFKCRDRGAPGGCEECGRTLGKEGSQEVEVTEEHLKENHIPEFYLTSSWDPDLLKREHPHLEGDRNFLNYVGQLDRIFKIHQSGQLSHTSAIIMAKHRMAKQTLAFHCMKQALGHGYTVAPLIDNTEYRRCNNLSAEMPYSKYLKQLPYSIEQLIHSDVCFMKIDEANSATAFRDIISLVDKRSRNNRATFVLVSQQIRDITAADWEGRFGSLVDASRTNNPFKYPVLVKYI